MGGQDQVGIYPSFQLGIHDHLSDDRGGLLNAYSRDGAFRKPYRTGALAIHCDDDAERSTISPAYVKIKEILVNAAQPGRYRINWQMKNGASMGNVVSRLYVNGAAVGAVHTLNSNIWTNFGDDYDVDLASGDLLQIYGGRSGGGGETTYIRNFRVCYDWGLYQFGDGGRVNLVTLLALTSLDLLDFTNQDP